MQSDDAASDAPNTNGADVATSATSVPSPAPPATADGHDAAVVASTLSTPDDLEEPEGQPDEVVSSGAAAKGGVTAPKTPGEPRWQPPEVDTRCTEAKGRVTARTSAGEPEGHSSDIAASGTEAKGSISAIQRAGEPKVHQPCEFEATQGILAPLVQFQHCAGSSGQSLQPGDDFTEQLMNRSLGHNADFPSDEFSAVFYGPEQLMPDNISDVTLTNSRQSSGDIFAFRPAYAPLPCALDSSVHTLLHALAPIEENCDDAVGSMDGSASIHVLRDVYDSDSSDCSAGGSTCTRPGPERGSSSPLPAAVMQSHGADPTVRAPARVTAMQILHTTVRKCLRRRRKEKSRGGMTAVPLPSTTSFWLCGMHSFLHEKSGQSDVAASADNASAAPVARLQTHRFYVQESDDLYQGNSAHCSIHSNVHYNRQEECNMGRLSAVSEEAGDESEQGTVSAQQSTADVICSI